MSITKQQDGKYKLDFRPWGREKKRIRKIFLTKSEAVRYQNMVLAEAQNKPWNGEKEDKRTLSELIPIWLNCHGQTLASPEKMKAKLEFLCEELGNPIASKLTAAEYTKFRGERLKNGKARTSNHDLAFMKGLYNKLIEIREIKYENPLASVKLIKLQEIELAFLSIDDIAKLEIALKNSTNKYVHIVSLICLSTGCRISEASNLRGSNIIKAGDEYKITFVNTKGKKRRTVPISKELYNQIPKKSGALFTDCRKPFERAIKKTDIILPEGQCSHVLRHTFASHFMMNGGNIIVLQRILGHAKIDETMRYAHFAPSHLEDAIRFNPISKSPQKDHNH